MYTWTQTARTTNHATGWCAPATLSCTRPCADSLLYVQLHVNATQHSSRVKTSNKQGNREKYYKNV